MTAPERQTLERMVGFPTVSNRPMRELAAYTAERAESAGFRVHMHEDPDRPGKCNVLAYAGPQDAPGEGLMLSGHLDVVPVEGQTWTSDPFRLTQREDRLVGRGKSVALALRALWSCSNNSQFPCPRNAGSGNPPTSEFCECTRDT